MEATQSVSAVCRTFAVLEYLALHKTAGVSEIARATGISKATVFRFLNTMVELGLVRKIEIEDQYQLTLKLFQVGSQALQYADLPAIAQPHMQSLADFCGETVHIAIHDNDNITYINKIDSRHSLQLVSRIGRRAPLHCTAIGKVLMAGLPQEPVADYLGKEPYERFTEYTLTGYEDYQNELEHVREQGFARDNEEHELNVRCVAAPIFDHLNRVVAGLSVSTPVFRHQPSQDEALISRLKKAASGISKDLGATDTCKYSY